MVLCLSNMWVKDRDHSIIHMKSGVTLLTFATMAMTDRQRMIGLDIKFAGHGKVLIVSALK